MMYYNNLITPSTVCLYFNFTTLKASLYLTEVFVCVCVLLKNDSDNPGLSLSNHSYTVDFAHLIPGFVKRTCDDAYDSTQRHRRTDSTANSTSSIVFQLIGKSEVGNISEFFSVSQR